MSIEKKHILAIDRLQEAFLRIPRILIFAFVAACAVFFIVHAGFFDDRMVCEDYRHFIESSAQRISLGRFFCFNLITAYCNSWMLGCQACLGFALAAVILVDLFKVRTKIGAVVVVILMITMPSMCYLFVYLFSAANLGRVAFLTALSVWIMARWRWGFLPATVIFAASLGVGQNALIFEAVLCSLVLLRDLMLERETFSYRRLMIKAVKMLVMGIVGVALYFLVWKLILRITGTSAANYKGMNQIGSFTLAQIVTAVKRSYVDFKDFFFGSRFFYVSRLQKIVYLLFFLVSGYSIVFACVKHPARIPGILVVLLSLPLCVGSVQIFVPQVKTDTLMVYPIIYALVFGVTIAESVLPQNHLGNVLSWSLLAALVVTGLSNYGITSAYYVKAEAYHEQTMAYENRLLMRIEEVPGYYEGIPIAFLSNGSNDYHGVEGAVFHRILNDRGLWYSFVGTKSTELKKTIDLINVYTGVKLKQATSAQIAQVQGTEEAADMTPYPMDGSIKVINGILTVNYISREIVVMQVDDNSVLLKHVTRSVPDETETIAWYVYRDGTRVPELERNYNAQNEHLITLTEDGTYTFKGFCNRGGVRTSIMSSAVVVKDGVISADTGLKRISQEEMNHYIKPEVEVSVTLYGERAVKLTMIDNYLNPGPEYTYAWYVYRNGERLREYDRWYSADPEYDLILAEDGEYRFKLFYRVGGVGKSVMSDTITIGEAQNNENAA